MFRGMWRWMRHVYYTKVLRQAGEPSYIARGVALGLLVGWVIPIGFQLIVVIPLAFLVRAAKIPAVVFTFVSNHFTVIFLYPMQCWIGSLVLGYPLTYEMISHQVREIAHAATLQESWNLFLELGTELGSSFIVGGFLLGIPSAAAGYVAALYLVKRYRNFKERRRLLKTNGREDSADVLKRNGADAPGKD